jgi:O-antigen ligase
MNEARVTGALTIVGLTGIAILFSVLLLHSSDLGLGLFIVGLALAMLAVEPFIGLLVYIVFTYTGPQSYVPALAGLRVMLVIGGATLVSMLARRVLTDDTPHTRTGPALYLLIWFLVAIIASHLAHLEFALALSSATDILSHLILCFLIMKLIMTENRLRYAFIAVFVGSVALALQGIIQHVAGVTLIDTPEYKGGRIAGIGQFVNPNMLAIALVCGLPIGYALLRRSRAVVARLIIPIGMVLLLVALYWTNSRSGALSLGVVMALALFRWLGPVRGLVLGAAIFVVIFQFGPSRMAMMSPTEASAFGRLVAWDMGYQIFFDNPLFGAGADSWYAKYRALVAHNSFLHCAAELGVFGLLPWVLIQVLSIRNLWFVSANLEGEHGESLGSYANALLLSFAGFAFASFFISKTYNVLLFILVGLATAIVNMYVASSGRRFSLLSKRDLALGIGVTLAGLVAFKVVLIMIGVGG